VTLRPGQKFRLLADSILPGQPSPVYLVLRVSSCSATVRPLAAQHVVIQDGDTTTADFWKAGRPFHISPNSRVDLLPEDPNPTS
jgi:hypothetical protein